MILERLVAVALLDGDLLILAIRLSATFLVAWLERLLFFRASLQCVPPTSRTSNLSFVPLTILADPQLVDRYSYGYVARLPLGIGQYVFSVIRWAADTYVRKSYAAVVRTTGRAQSHAIIWLGDLLDGGRLSWDPGQGTQKEYANNVMRFRSLFKERLPTVYVPGNHDVRIPLTHDDELERETHNSKERWLATWGTWCDYESRQCTWSVGETGRVGKRVASKKVTFTPSGSTGDDKSRVQPVDGHHWRRTVNARLPIYLDGKSAEPSHEIILVDALELAGMTSADPEGAETQEFNPIEAGRVHKTAWWQEGLSRFPDTTRFVDSLVKSENTASGKEPVRILISHIPLWRPHNEQCTQAASSTDSRRILDHDWRREGGGGIEQNIDRSSTYQNLLAKPISDWLLYNARPTLVFSGDNHDHCHVKHSTAHGTVEELTLKAFSMTGGVRNPGYARVWLTFDQRNDHADAIAMPCPLPDQVAIWTRVYPAALIVLLFVWAVIRFVRPNAYDRRYGSRRHHDFTRTGILNGLADQDLSNAEGCMADDSTTIIEQFGQLLLLPLAAWLYFQLF